MSQQPPLVLTKNIRIILGQFGIFVVLWSFTVIDYGVKSDRAPLVVGLIKDTGRSQGGLLCSCPLDRWTARAHASAKR